MTRTEYTADDTALFNNFCNVTTVTDLANLLDVQPKWLAFVLYAGKDNRASRYNTYAIKKKNGGDRIISAPNEDLKKIQRRLNEILQTLYWQRPSAHAFLLNKSIATNAAQHVKKKNILNIDLKDFFPSISFGRVRAMFMAKPFQMNANAATMIAQIVCHEQRLPQGGATSPIISNMICSRLDGEFQKFSKKNKCTYTRYADDISFSTNLLQFPESVCKIENDESIVISEEIIQIIKSNGFEINDKKTRLHDANFRQEVTGLVVNQKVNVSRQYVRNVRAILHNWEKHGLEDVMNKGMANYGLNRKPKNFQKVIRGKIEFIKFIRSGHEATKEHRPLELVETFLNKFYLNCIRDSSKTVIRTEGKTDWMYLRRAYSELRTINAIPDLNIEFSCVQDDFFFGNQTLIGFCKQVLNGKVRPFKNKVICLFDSDVTKINSQHTNGQRHWGGNVYSLILPEAKIDNNTVLTNYCIEELITAKDRNISIQERYLFLSSDFHKNGVHKKMPHVKYQGGDIDTKNVSVLDEKVLDTKQNRIISISKLRFAKAVFHRSKGFEKFDFTNFIPIFKALEELITKTT